MHNINYKNVANVIAYFDYSTANTLWQTKDVGQKGFKCSAGSYILVRLFQQLAAEDRKCRLSYARLKAVLLSLSEAVALEQYDCELPSRLESLQLSDALKCE